MEQQAVNRASNSSSGQVRYEEVPLVDPAGRPLERLHSVWLTLDNPSRLNALSSTMVDELAAAFRRASDDLGCVAVVLTGSGTRAFCTGGDIAEYNDRYLDRPEAYSRYMAAFQDMMAAILTCEKPVICRVNGLRIGGGHSLGLACDLSVAQDMAVFGQVGPRRGSAPVAGSTDFMPLMIGVELATEACILCEPWSAHKALRLGMICRIAPALRVDGKLVPNPRVITDRWVDEFGRIVYGEFKQGEELEAAERLIARGTVELSPLDREVQRLIWTLANTLPGCLNKTLSSLRRHKLQCWSAERESNRAWLALNMMTEGALGFRAFHQKRAGQREPDFIQLRQKLAAGRAWDERLIAELLEANPQ